MIYFLIGSWVNFTRKYAHLLWFLLFIFFLLSYQLFMFYFHYPFYFIFIFIYLFLFVFVNKFILFIYFYLFFYFCKFNFFRSARNVIHPDIELQKRKGQHQHFCQKDGILSSSNRSVKLVAALSTSLIENFAHLWRFTIELLKYEHIRELIQLLCWLNHHLMVRRTEVALHPLHSWCHSCHHT